MSRRQSKSSLNRVAFEAWSPERAAKCTQGRRAAYRNANNPTTEPVGDGGPANPPRTLHLSGRLAGLYGAIGSPPRSRLCAARQSTRKHRGRGRVRSGDRGDNSPLHPRYIESPDGIWARLNACFYSIVMACICSRGRRCRSIDYAVEFVRTAADVLPLPAPHF